LDNYCSNYTEDRVYIIDLVTEVEVAFLLHKTNVDITTEEIEAGVFDKRIVYWQDR